MASQWLGFLVCAAAILVSGTQLSRLGDRLADKTRLGRTWIGVVLLASVTSLPELLTGFSAVVFYDSPNIAVGNVLGASMINILLIGVLDVLAGGQPLTARVHQGHVLTAALGVLLLSVLAAGFLVDAAFSIGHVGIYSVLVFLLYFFSLRMIFSHERRRLLEAGAEGTGPEKREKGSVKSILLRFVFNALVISAAAAFLPGIAERIADQSGWGRTFVGSVFVALTTTLPEIVVGFSALRIGALDLAVGNMLGSVLFNLFIFAVEDALYVKGPILAGVSPDHLVSVLACIAMTACVLIGLTARTGKRFLFFVWDSFGIVSIYLLAVVLLAHR